MGESYKAELKLADLGIGNPHDSIHGGTIPA